MKLNKMKKNENQLGKPVGSGPTPPTTLREIIKLHDAIIAAAHLSLENAFRIGELLGQEKSRLEHGQWLAWIEQNVPFSNRSARNYMRLYENRDRLKLASVASLTSAYQILAKRDGPNDPNVNQPAADVLAADNSEAKPQIQSFEEVDDETPRHAAVNILTSVSASRAPEPVEKVCGRTRTPESDTTTIMVPESKSVEVQLRGLWLRAAPPERSRFMAWVDDEAPELQFGPSKPAESKRIKCLALSQPVPAQEELISEPK